MADTLAEDTSRIVHRFSAVEEHYWAGWYFGTVRDLLAPAKTGIITEFGAQALPRLSTLKPSSRRRRSGQNDRRRRSRLDRLEIP